MILIECTKLSLTEHDAASTSGAASRNDEPGRPLGDYPESESAAVASNSTPTIATVTAAPSTKLTTRRRLQPEPDGYVL